jgi:hypothetical protein
LLVAGAVAAVALIAFIVASVSSEGGGVGETADVSISGSALPRLPDQPEADPAVGASMPELRGTGFDGAEIAVVADGRPKVLLFMAHW